MAAILVVSVVSFISLFGAYEKYQLQFRRRLVQATTFDIIDEILHYNPAIPEPDWINFMTEQFAQLVRNEPEEIWPILIDNTSVPMCMAFFALYYNLTRGDPKGIPRAKLNNFVRGADMITDEAIEQIVVCAYKGASAWKAFVDDECGEVFTQFLLNIFPQTVRASLTPYFSSG